MSEYYLFPTWRALRQDYTAEELIEHILWLQTEVKKLAQGEASLTESEVM